MTDSKLFLDSNIWLGYVLGNFPKTKEIVESKNAILFTSIICLHEVYKKMKKISSETDAKKAIQFMEDNSIIIGINKEIAIQAAENCEMHKLHTIDSLIYSSAQNLKVQFITADIDFKNLPNTQTIQLG
ncbi:MAG: PIN domain-containing protein [Candidatus Diapherotrites archaeon]|nr:PIN domain-containing protein [Candidatus Diapherotrites archaeon]